jgi:hypothetical protein
MCVAMIQPPTAAAAYRRTEHGVPSAFPVTTPSLVGQFDPRGAKSFLAMGRALVVQLQLQLLLPLLPLPDSTAPPKCQPN